MLIAVHCNKDKIMQQMSDSCVQAAQPEPGTAPNITCCGNSATVPAPLFIDGAGILICHRRITTGAINNFNGISVPIQ